MNLYVMGYGKLRWPFAAIALAERIKATPPPATTPPVVGVDDYEVSATAGNVFTGAKADSLTQTVSVNITGDEVVELGGAY